MARLITKGVVRGHGYSRSFGGNTLFFVLVWFPHVLWKVLLFLFSLSFSSEDDSSIYFSMKPPIKYRSVVSTAGSSALHVRTHARLFLSNLSFSFAFVVKGGLGHHVPIAHCQYMEQILRSPYLTFKLCIHLLRDKITPLDNKSRHRFYV